MQLENYTKKDLINLIKQQQKSNEYERKFLYEKIKELEEKIRGLRQ